MKKIICAILLITLIVSLSPSAFADGILDALETSEIDVTAEDAWDQYVKLLLEYTHNDELGYYQQLAFGYYNFATGEEYYYNGDQYMVAASLYKVPLNMLFCDGTEEGAKYYDMKLSDVQYSTLFESSNTVAEILFNSIGGYDVFKFRSKEYLMDDVEEKVPYNFNFDNIFTPRQFIHCLKILQNEPERFPNMLYYMKLAESNHSFKRDVQWCEIASKTGFYSNDQNIYAVNEMGIVYTTQTFAIVMMTNNLKNPNDILADYCTLMCEYTNARNQAEKEHIVDLLQLLQV